MKRFSILFLFVLLISLSLRAYQNDNDSDFRAFMDQLQDNFFLPLMNNAVRIDNRQRAMLFGYALKIQNGYMEEFYTDMDRMYKLQSEVKKFFDSLSAEESLWPVVEAAMEGEHDNTVLQLLGRPPEYEPVFKSIGASIEGRQVTGIDYFQFKDQQDIEGVLVGLFMTWQSQDYLAMENIIGGKMKRQFVRYLERMRSTAEGKTRLERMSHGVDYDVVRGTVYSGMPEFVSLVVKFDNTYGPLGEYRVDFLKDSYRYYIIKLDIFK